MFSGINANAYPIQTFAAEMVRSSERQIFGIIRDLRKTLRATRLPVHRNILAGAIRVARDELNSREEPP